MFHITVVPYASNIPQNDGQKMRICLLPKQHAMPFVLQLPGVCLVLLFRLSAQLQLYALIYFIIFYCIVRYCANFSLLYYTILFDVIFCSAVLYYVVLHYTLLYYGMLQYRRLGCIILYCISYTLVYYTRYYVVLSCIIFCSILFYCILFYYAVCILLFDNMCLESCRAYNARLGHAGISAIRNSRGPKDHLNTRTLCSGCKAQDKLVGFHTPWFVESLCLGDLWDSEIGRTDSFRWGRGQFP